MLSQTKDGRTRPPLRLRMLSADMLCARSMELKWEDGTGVQRQWSSWTDETEGGWYEAVKLLPSCATDISVRFQVRGVGGPYPVCAVDRRKRSTPWVQGLEGAYVEEAVHLRSDCDHISDGVDVVFELCGPMHGCYVCRAWNAARAGSRQPWEWWPERDSRPKEEAPLSALKAADLAAPLSAGQGHPQAHYACATKRMCAAARRLLDMHRWTLAGLRHLDSRFTGQWLGVNMGNTASAGLGIASAVLLFVAPPVGVGLGIGSAVTSGITFAGDSLADRAHQADLRQQLALDDWNVAALAELLDEWARALQALGARLPPGAGQGSDKDGDDEAGGISVSEAVEDGLMAGAVVDGAAATATQVATHVADLGRTAAVASQAVGITGAIISTGFAIKGWSTTKAGQAAVRAKVAELTQRLLDIQRLLVEFDILECPICAVELTFMDDVRWCSHYLHCFHAGCLGRWEASRGDACPLCKSPLDPDADVMASFAGGAFKLRPQERLTPASRQ